MSTHADDLLDSLRELVLEAFTAPAVPASKLMGAVTAFSMLDDEILLQGNLPTAWKGVPC